MNNKVYDFMVVGAGFFGSTIAYHLAKKNYTVALIDRENEIMLRASCNNQARVHNGYHYPRSYLTAHGSHKNYAKFISEFNDCVYSDFDHIYAIPKNNTHTTALQFESMCRSVGCQIKKTPRHLQKYFNKDVFETTFLAEENVINTNLLASTVKKRLSVTDKVSYYLGSPIKHLESNDHLIKASFINGKKICATSLINVTYAGLNEILSKLQLPTFSLKAELAEICYVKPLRGLEHTGITVMDGLFFSYLPNPAKSCFTLTHVRNTPHSEVNLAMNPKINIYKYFLEKEHKSRFIHMRNSCSLMIPCFKRLEYKNSDYEIKAILQKNETNDGRPIMLVKHQNKPRIYSVLGSKLDSYYEVIDAIDELF